MHHGFISAETFALTIPLLAITGGIAIAVVAIIAGGRRKELVHKERIIAMEKGIAIPEADVAPARPAYLKNRTGGLVMTMIGIALTIAMWVTGGAEAGVWGLIPLGIGVGLLISSALERREADALEAKVEQSQPGSLAPPVM